MARCGVETPWSIATVVEVTPRAKYRLNGPTCLDLVACVPSWLENIVPALLCLWLPYVLYAPYKALVVVSTCSLRKCHKKQPPQISGPVLVTLFLDRRVWICLDYLPFVQPFISEVSFAYKVHRESSCTCLQGFAVVLH